jgi:hypothetical protein
MAKEEKGKEKGGEGEKGKKAKKHLHQIRSVQAEDGSIVHHHTYKAKKEDHHTEPERENVATSATPEEAGEHVAEQMGMNGQGGGGEPEEEAAEGEQGGAPQAGAAQPGV